MKLREGNIFIIVCPSISLSMWGSHMTIIHDSLDLTVQGPPSGHGISEPSTQSWPLLGTSGDHHWSSRSRGCHAPCPVKFSHKKDGRRMRSHRFHFSWPLPYPAPGSTTVSDTGYFFNSVHFSAPHHCWHLVGSTFLLYMAKASTCIKRADKSFTISWFCFPLKVAWGHLKLDVKLPNVNVIYSEKLNNFDFCTCNSNAFVIFVLYR